MGVLNVTPDSFSDGGRYLATEAAIAHGLEMVAEGADIIDVGGESSRPGAEPVESAVEMERVDPGDRGPRPPGAGLDRHGQAGGGRGGPGGGRLDRQRHLLLPVGGGGRRPAAPARSGPAGWVAVHMQGTPATMQAAPHYDDVVSEVFGFVLERAREALAGGVREVWVDPGIGFGKSACPQSRPAPPPPRAGGGGRGRRMCRGPGRNQPQAVPRACWRRRPAATSRWGSTSGSRAPWPRPPGPWWRGPPWSGCTTWRSRCRLPGCMVQQHEGKVGSGNPATELHLGHEGSSGHQRAARRVRPQPPQGARAAKRSSGCATRASGG